MNCFLVVLTPESTIEGKEVEECFPEVLPVTDRAWVVAGKEETAFEVSSSLGMLPESEGRRLGVVVSLVEGSYDGLAPQDFWRQIAKWDAA